MLISADTDFGTLLALREEQEPSFVLLRGRLSRRPEDQATLILANLPQVRDSLDNGAVVVIEPGRVRVRSLPIQGGESS